VSLLAAEKIAEFGDLAPGAFGENLVVEGLDLRVLPLGTRLAVGETLLEITQHGKECHHPCSIYEAMGDCIMPREGVFARVVCDGVISTGDVVELLEQPEQKLRAAILILSDKGSQGRRVDESGPLIARMLTEAGYLVAEQILLPDEQSAIENELITLADMRRVDLILTCGGTGFSRRDVTPEATLAVAHRVASGVAEAIRAHSLKITGRAMLSRAVSVIRGGTLIVNLPGSPKAARESLEFILPHLGHGLEILRGDTGECAASGSKC